jgi:single-stranded DNA-binding protein
MATSNINRVVLTGNLTRDPLLRETSFGTRSAAAHRFQHAAQDQQRRVGRQAHDRADDAVAHGARSGGVSG